MRNPATPRFSTRFKHLATLGAAALAVAFGFLTLACAAERPGSASATTAPSANTEPLPQPAPSGGVAMASGRSPVPTPEEQANRLLSPKRTRRDRTPLHVEERTATAPAVTGEIVIDGANGSVRVRGVDRSDFLIRAEVAATTPERLAASRLVAAKSATGGLRIAVDWMGGERLSPEAVAYEIEMPNSLSGVLPLALRVSTTNAEVELIDCLGAARVSTTVGGVRVINQRGAVYAKTTNARIDIERPQGEVRANATNAGVSVIEPAAAVSVETTNGGVRVALPAKWPEMNPPGPFILSTSFGIVSLESPGGFTGQAIIETDSRTIEIDPSLGVRLRREPGSPQSIADFGNEGPPLTPGTVLTSKNGGVRIGRKPAG